MIPVEVTGGHAQVVNKRARLDDDNDDIKKKQCPICSKFYCRLNRHIKDVHDVKS